MQVASGPAHWLGCDFRPCGDNIAYRLRLARNSGRGHNLPAHHTRMRILLRYLAVAGCLFSGRPAVAAEEPKPGSEEAVTAALAWLSLLDDEKYADSWKEAATHFKTMVSEKKWVNAMNQGRQPLGSVTKREFKEASLVHELLRAPKGDYWVIQFATMFEGSEAIETVTPMLDKDGKWHVSAYALKPAA